jgi:signal transduction histidine kinase
LTSDLPTALKTLLNVGLQIEGVDCGGVYLRDEATGALTLATHCGLFSAKFIKQVSHYQGSSDRAEIVSKGLAVYGLYRQLPSHADDADEHEGLRAVAVVPLCHEGTVIGCLNLGSHTVDSLPNDTRAVVEAIAAQAAGAIARTRAETERRRLEAQLLEIADREQARIGQEIHDGLCQQLVSLAFDANALVNELNKSRRSEAKIASRLAHHLDQAITEARRLARGLFPIRLETEGLVSAVEELARTTRERFEIQCDFTCVPPLPSQAPAEATHLFKIAQEAVNNAVKHGRARRILIQLKSTDDHLELQVEDDGVGLRAEPADKMAGMGRHIMDYRARSLGGQIRVTPREPGGTRVSCCVPRHRASSGGA